MARPEGTYKFGSNFEPKFNAPVDARLVVPTKTDLYAMQYAYRGMQVYVKDEDTYYRLINDLPALEASWQEVVSGGQYDLIEVTTAEIDAMFT